MLNIGDSSSLIDYLVERNPHVFEKRLLEIIKYLTLLLNFLLKFVIRAQI